MTQKPPPMARTKSFFFEKIFDPDFDPNFDFYFGDGIVLFQKKIDFFSIFFVIYAPKNGFRPLRE